LKFKIFIFVIVRFQNVQILNSMFENCSKFEKISKRFSKTETHRKTYEREGKSGNKTMELHASLTEGTSEASNMSLARLAFAPRGVSEWGCVERRIGAPLAPEMRHWAWIFSG
jgi:hypothetical protein